MGTPMAPNNANIFLDVLERNLISEYQQKTGLAPLIWYRYIDDILFIWNHGDETLKDFIQFCQDYSNRKKMKSNIKFEVNASPSKVNFLDVTISIKEGKLTTSLFVKPTDAHMYLDKSSSHPKHVIANIPKGQFIRIRRICTYKEDYIKHSTDMIKHFNK